MICELQTNTLSENKSGSRTENGGKYQCSALHLFWKSYEVLLHAHGAHHCIATLKAGISKIKWARQKNLVRDRRQIAGNNIQ